MSNHTSWLIVALIAILLSGCDELRAVFGKRTSLPGGDPRREQLERCNRMPEALRQQCLQNVPPAAPAR